MFSKLSNDDIAEALERLATLLELKDESAYRVMAYRTAARSVRADMRSMADIVREEGKKGLLRLPAVGKSIAAAIAELVTTGRLGLLERLEEEVTPEQRLAQVPGIGPSLAKRVHEVLGASTLEDLEMAAHDGRLERVPGFGPRRARAVREILGAMMDRAARGRHYHSSGLGSEGARNLPPIELLLDVDAEYRVGAELGVLPQIAPRRFNPSGSAWLPIRETAVDGWSFRAMYSNTWRAHQRHACHDWVVIHFERDGEEGLCTVVTETVGALRGRRVVRGHEAECRANYAMLDRGLRAAGAA